MAGDISRARFMAAVDAEWLQEMREIRATLVDLSDPFYLGYQKVRRERGLVAAFYWLKARRAEVAREQAQLETQREQAQRLQDIWRAVSKPDLVEQIA